MASGSLIDPLLRQAFSAPLLLLWLSGGLVLCGVLLFLIRQMHRLLPAKVYVESVASILTPAERLFMQSLEIATDGRWRISFKVRVADVIEVTSTNGRERQRLFRRIAAKHIDFLLTDPETFEPVLALELDDSSHDRIERRQRDEFLDELFAVAQLPLVRVDAASRYSPDKISRALKAALVDR